MRRSGILRTPHENRHASLQSPSPEGYRPFAPSNRFRLMFSRSLLCLTCCLVLNGTITPTGRAQPVKAWFSGGLGGSAASKGVGLSGRASAQVVLGKLAISGRLTANSGGSSGIEGLFGTMRDEYFDGGLIVGYAPPSDGGGQVVVGGGPAIVWGRRIVGRERPPCGFLGCGAEWEDVDPVLGFAVEAGVYGRLSSVVGISLVLHSNINSKQFFLGGTLGLTAGKLR